MFLGRYNIFTFIVLLSVSVVSYFVLENLLSTYLRPGGLKNMRLLFFAIIFAIFLLELLLRYGLGNYQSYSERNGQLSYISHYRQCMNWDINTWLGNRKNRIRNVNTSEFKYQVFYNSMGIRDKEISLLKPEHEFRIIGIGDSFTEGEGVILKDTWLKKLETNQSIKINTINGGRSGSDPIFGYMMLERFMLQYNPDLVIITVNSSDIDDLVVRGGFDRFKADGSIKFKKGPWWEWLYGTSFIIRHIICDLCGYNSNLYQPDDWQVLRKKALKEIYYCLKQFKILLEKNNVKFFIVFHPLWQETVKDFWPFTGLIKEIRRTSEMNILNLLSYFKNEKINSKNIFQYYWPIDGHHTKKGYEVFANGVAQELIKLID